MCIYGILGVEFFGSYAEEKCRDGDTSNLGDADCWTNMNNKTISQTTARGINYGSEYYGTFFRALYTLFQVLTGESWSEAGSRLPSRSFP